MKKLTLTTQEKEIFLEDIKYTVFFKGDEKIIVDSQKIDFNNLSEEIIIEIKKDVELFLSNDFEIDFFIKNFMRKNKLINLETYLNIKRDLEETILKNESARLFLKNYKLNLENELTNDFIFSLSNIDYYFNLIDIMKDKKSFDINFLKSLKEQAINSNTKESDLLVLIINLILN